VPTIYQSTIAREEVGTLRFARPTALSGPDESDCGMTLPESDGPFRAAKQRQDASPDKEMSGESRQ